MGPGVDSAKAVMAINTESAFLEHLRSLKEASKPLYGNDPLGRTANKCAACPLHVGSRPVVAIVSIRKPPTERPSPPPCWPPCQVQRPAAGEVQGPRLPLWLGIQPQRVRQVPHLPADRPLRAGRPPASPLPQHMMGFAAARVC